MAPRQPMSGEQRRLLRITARMPLASAANLASVTGLDEERVRRILNRLRSGGWVASVMRGMTERRQHRFFLTSQVVALLYETSHQHPSPREEARATGLAAFHPQGELPQLYQERFALDHDHPVHLENQGDSPFVARERADDTGDGTADHEHPPWTATSRGVAMSLRRLAMLEPVYRLAPRPDPRRQGQPARRRHVSHQGSKDDRFPPAPARRLLPRRGPLRRRRLDHLHLRRHPRHRRVLRRKEQHRFWGVGLLFQRGGPLFPHRQPHLLR